MDLYAEEQEEIPEKLSDTMGMIREQTERLSETVSYTHLDVYKRQSVNIRLFVSRIAGVHGMPHLMDDRENIL